MIKGKFNLTFLLKIFVIFQLLPEVDLSLAVANNEGGDDWLVVGAVDTADVGGVVGVDVCVALTWDEDLLRCCLWCCCWVLMIDDTGVYGSGSLTFSVIFRWPVVVDSSVVLVFIFSGSL